MSEGVGDEIDLGGCEGCSLSCGVTCAAGPSRGAEHADQARQVLLAAGVAVALLALGPALVGGAALAPATGAAAVGCAATVAVLAQISRRRGRPGGDVPARAAYRLLPLAVALMLATWVAAIVLALR